MAIVINNLPNDEPLNNFIVYREVRGENWYWGDWDDPDTALEEALDVHGKVIPREWVA